MKAIRFVPVLGLFSLLLAGCGSLDLSGNDNKRLGNVEYTVRAMYEGHERMVDISPAGEVVIVEQLHDVLRPRIVSEITPSERTDLLAAFRDWKKLKHEYFIDVSPQIVISYDGWTVTTSSADAVPEPFKQAKTVLDRIAITLTMAADAKTAAATAASGTQPGTQPSSQPATAPGN